MNFEYPLASPALGHELGPNGAARDGGQVEQGISDNEVLLSCLKQ
jgi:hypothetical protein